ncbi:L-rhamnonate dehydratase [Clostridia bacterium]|nr:L-rhamnonate dehydratase [Clostridia bacterium]
MKITGIKIIRRTIWFEPRYRAVARSCGPLDIWDEYNARGRETVKNRAPDKGGGEVSGNFLVVTTDEGFEGCSGPVENRSELLTAVDGLAQHIVGRDPLNNRMIWDIMSRFDRHSRAGLMMMAISAVDIAIWDLKGKILGQPVYRLLGGGRERIRPYFSTLAFSLDIQEATKMAKDIKALGVRAQKWFFRWGPAEGAEGMRKNLDLAFALRDAVGPDYELMFDCWMGWTVNYAKAAFRELETVRPMWVEEVLRPHMLDGFRKLREETDIPLSSGEHFYTRMEVNQFLKDNIISVMQSDPVWCGGITECLRIADLCEMYGATFIPHGHEMMSAMHIVATMPPDVSPYCEYLLCHMDRKNAFFKEKRLGEDGWLTINDTPGLGEEIDEERMISAETVTEFKL